MIATSNVRTRHPVPAFGGLDTACPNNPPADAANSRFLNDARAVRLLEVGAADVHIPCWNHVHQWAGSRLDGAFNTTHYGYSPIGEIPLGCFFTDPGCGYDSLNVGAKTYAPAAFAGTDVNNDEAFISWGANGNTLGPDWAGRSTGHSARSSPGRQQIGRTT